MSLEKLQAALSRRLAVVADHELRDRDPAAHLAALMQAHQDLEQVVAGMPPSMDPRLRHFLERQSYEKALAFLRE